MNARSPLRAPREDGAVVAEPPFHRVGSLLHANRERFAAQTSDLLGLSSERLRPLARSELLNAAREYLGTSENASPTGPLLMSGHQPELFHPGVWVKNFALAGLARKHGGVAVNLVVDNDTVKSTTLRIPVPASLDLKWPRSLNIPFDHWNGETPYEEAVVRDEQLFAKFGDEVSELMRGWGFEPLLSEYWKDVRRQVEVTPLLGERFARARRELEGRWGCRNLEVPVSRVCQGRAFAHFACHLLLDLPRFHALYNTTVREYRIAHGIRSRNHPVPDLVREGDWLEAPFWAWCVGQTRRSRLLVRRIDNGLELRAGAERWSVLPYNADDPDRLLNAWQDLEAQGRKVRSRALTNTLYARVFLCDLFLHGIGGGKYDELTDELIRRFYALEPPEYLILSATRLLPISGYPVTAADHRRLARHLRDLHWNPERHLPCDVSENAEIQTLVGIKRRAVEQHPSGASDRRERFAAIRTANDQLRGLVDQETARTREMLTHIERELEANEVLRRRDYAFCLYPESVLRPFCSQFLEAGTPNSPVRVTPLSPPKRGRGE